MNSIHANGSVTSDCPYCPWGSGELHTVGEAMTAALEHMDTCETRAAFFASIRNGHTDTLRG